MPSSLSAAWTCQECRKPRRGARHPTMTGRVICGPCQRGLDAAVLGMSSGDRLSTQMESAVGIHGLRELLRRKLGRKD